MSNLVLLNSKSFPLAHFFVIDGQVRMQVTNKAWEDFLEIWFVQKEVVHSRDIAVLTDGRKDIDLFKQRLRKLNLKIEERA